METVTITREFFLCGEAVGGTTDTLILMNIEESADEQSEGTQAPQIEIEETQEEEQDQSQFTGVVVEDSVEEPSYQSYFDSEFWQTSGISPIVEEKSQVSCFGTVDV